MDLKGITAPAEQIPFQVFEIHENTIYMFFEVKQHTVFTVAAKF